MYQQMEDQFVTNETMFELERRKKQLKSIWQLHQPIPIEDLKKHNKSYQQSLDKKE